MTSCSPPPPPSLSSLSPERWQCAAHHRLCRVRALNRLHVNYSVSEIFINYCHVKNTTLLCFLPRSAQPLFCRIRPKSSITLISILFLIYVFISQHKPRSERMLCVNPPGINLCRFFLYIFAPMIAKIFRSFDVNVLHQSNET